MSLQAPTGFFSSSHFFCSLPARYLLFTLLIVVEDLFVEAVKSTSHWPPASSLAQRSKEL